MTTIFNLCRKYRTRAGLEVTDLHREHGDNSYPIAGKIVESAESPFRRQTWTERGTVYHEGQDEDDLVMDTPADTPTDKPECEASGTRQIEVTSMEAQLVTILGSTAFVVVAGRVLKQQPDGHLSDVTNEPPKSFGLFNSGLPASSGLYAGQCSSGYPRR